MNVDDIHLMVYWESIHLVSYLMQELILQVCRFCGLVCGTYKVFKIRVKVVRKIAWLVTDDVKSAAFLQVNAPLTKKTWGRG